MTPNQKENLRKRYFPSTTPLRHRERLNQDLRKSNL